MKLTPAYIAAQVLTCAFDYDGTFTTCTITTKHGTKHVGTSGCLDPANYNRETGEQIAHKNALDQLWALEGYFFSKLGLSQAQGIVDERLGVGINRTDGWDRAERWGQHHVSVMVYMDHSYPSQAKKAKPNEFVINQANIHFSPEELAKAIQDHPGIWRSMGRGGLVGGKKDGAE